MDVLKGSQQGSVAPLPKLQVLVVDDIADTATSLAELLKEMGHDAHAETDPRVVVERVRELHPQLVFLDLGMPGIDGFRLAEMLRAEFGFSFYLVAVTGYGTKEDRAHSRKAGFDAHILKPMDIPLLESTLATIIAKPRTPISR